MPLKNSVMQPAKLKKIINNNGIPLGSSAQGEAWSLAALHPAHPVSSLSGIPDDNCVPSAVVEFRSTYSLGAPAGTSNAWAFSGAFIPNVIIYGFTTRTNDAPTPVITPLNIVNTQVISSNDWRNLVSAARLCYYGVTIFVDTPALADQGTLVATQLQQNWTISYNIGPPIPANYAAAPVTYANLVNLPGAVTWVAREGLYFPVRLSNPAFIWKEQATQYVYGGVLVGGANTISVPQCLDSLISVASIQNLSPLASIRITIRMGVQVQVPPQSPYSPFIRMSPPADRIAVDAYFAISSRLNDAYPASYNDWNALWNVIKKVGSFLRPAVQAIPTFGPPVVALGEKVASAVEARRVKRGSNGNGRGKKNNGK